MTRQESLKTAIAEANRFIKKAREALNVEDNRKTAESEGKYVYHYDKPGDSCKFASAERSSMDLTRCLAQLRKSER
jgi:hypothetical protein